jgi:hypothetical protein
MRLLLAGVVLLLATPAAAGWQKMCRQQFHACRKSHAGSINQLPQEVLLHCNGRPVRCVRWSITPLAPLETWCDTQDVSACGLPELTP